MRNNSIDLASLILQIINLELIFKDFNNSDLMVKLNTIAEQNERIIALLEGGDNDEWYVKTAWKIYSRKK